MMPEPTIPDKTRVEKTLGLAPESSLSVVQRLLGGIKKPWVILVLAGMLALLWVWLGTHTGNTPQYLTESVEKGHLVVKISATGNIQPTTQVDVGSELSGTVENVFVNDNDKVTKGQILAKLDTHNLKDQVVKSKASLKAAQAGVETAQASLLEAEDVWQRQQKTFELSGGRIPSQESLVSAKAAWQKAKANRASAVATVTQAEATLRSDETNLNKADILSPIDGVVLLRQVEPGQTVAASLQAPTLFVLAQNLKQMELQVNIDEADVGQVKEGVSATFTVDAYPDRTFPAAIQRVRFGSESTNGVVTYQGVLEVANDDLSLRPGMTATASIMTLEKENVLLVPNAALRFNPTTQATAKASSGGVVSALLPHPPREQKTKEATTTVVSGSKQTIWVLRNQVPVRIPVVVGASDGKHTEVQAGEIQPGEAVITDSVGNAS